MNSWPRRRRRTFSIPVCHCRTLSLSLFVLTPLCLFAALPSAHASVVTCTTGLGPYVLSGTNCSAGWVANTSGYVYVGPPQYYQIRYIAKVDLYIGGDLAKTVSYTNAQSAEGSVKFDSTHFGDGGSIYARATVTTTLGEIESFDSPIRPVYNKLYLYGNVGPAFNVNGIGELHEGADAVAYVAGQFAGTNHTIGPSGGVAQIQQQKGDITAALPAYTVFYCWSHGTNNGGDALGDSAALAADTGLHFDAHWLLPGDIYNAIYDATNGKTAKGYPDYNFAYIDSCSLGDGNMAGAFNISGTASDKAYLGWATAMADNLHNVNWSKNLFSYLAGGRSLAAAIAWVNNSLNPDYNGEAQDGGLNPVGPVLIGDGSYKLHGVYSIENSTIWHN